jgi:hypothetical protein
MKMFERQEISVLKNQLEHLQSKFKYTNDGLADILKIGRIRYPMGRRRFDRYLVVVLGVLGTLACCYQFIIL